MSKDNQAMILASDRSSHFIAHHISIDKKNKSDWFEIYDTGKDVAITIKNEETGDKAETFYHLEMDKNSRLWKHLVEVINSCNNSR